MKKFYLLLIFLFFLKIIYSQSYIVCDTSIQSSCFLRLYSTTNSHVVLCNQTGFLNYGCEIRNDPYTIPISFSSINCQGLSSLFLYKVSNSHIGYAKTYDSNIYSGTFPICLDLYFRDVLEITNTTVPGDLDTFFLIGLYNLTNSHATLDKNVRVPIYLKILDRTSPEVNINDTNKYIVLPTTFKINFSDDKYMYYCQIYVNDKLYDSSLGCRFKNYFEFLLTVTYKECPPDVCIVKAIGVDLAGNVKTIERSYIVINPCLQIEALPLTWDSITIIDFAPYDLKITISNPRTCYGNFTNITVSFPDTDCYNLILVDGLQKRTVNITRLNNGESYEIRTRIYPLRLGRCNFVITVEGYVEGLNMKQVYKKEIPLSVSVRTPVGLLVISEPWYSIIIAILLISLVLFL